MHFVIQYTLTEKSEEKRPLGRPGRRWKDDIRKDLKELRKVWTGCTWLRIGAIDGLL
jgi:hypothetical protein